MYQIHTYSVQLQKQETEKAKKKKMGKRNRPQKTNLMYIMVLQSLMTAAITEKGVRSCRIATGSRNGARGDR